MKKIFCILLIIIFFANIGQAQLLVNSERLSNQNGFQAKIGVRGSDEAQIFLDGKFRAGRRSIAVSGTATNGEGRVRFQGFFRGHFFILQIPLRGRIVNIFGRSSFNEDGAFRGSWMVRGTSTRITGWIQGSFSR